jgi:hypothetical protein
MSGDNYQIIIKSDDINIFNKGLDIVITNDIYRGYSIDNIKGFDRLIIYWSIPDKYNLEKLNTEFKEFPFKMSKESLKNFITDWLKQASYGPQPDHDGDNHKGFIISTGDFWGHIEFMNQTSFSVQTDWQMYGK